MARYNRDVKNSLNNIERSMQATEQSAARSAQSDATTARATQSAATGAWVGAGFQAVTAFQAARAARAAEEQLALQQAMAERQQNMEEQATWHQFSMWRQSAEGVAFLAWRDPAFRLAQFLRNRDSEWLQGWARAIGRAQAEIPEGEKQRVRQHPARLKQTGLLAASIAAFVLAGLFALGLLVQIFASSMAQSAPDNGDFTYEQCLATLSDPDNLLLSQSDCDAIRPAGPPVQLAVPLALSLGAGIVLLVVRRAKRRAARADQTVANEAQARVERWGFDPLAVGQGYTGFAWSQSPDADGYADRLMALALYDGHGRPPTESQLVAIDVPASWSPQENHPEEVNELLERFARERPAAG